MDRDRFCQCPCCRAWFSSRDILENPEVEPIGMTFDGGDPQFNLFYFNHVVADCGSTFAVAARRFASFLPEPAPPDVLAGTPECEGHCTSLADLAECHSRCHWAPYRRFLLSLQERRTLPESREEP